MKIDYISDGSSDCPIIRIFGNSKQECQILTESILKLSKGIVDEIQVHTLPGFIMSNNCELYFSLGKDLGLKQQEMKKFVCILTSSSWGNIADKLNDFCSGLNGFQWLDETGDISLLYSTSGEW